MRDISLRRFAWLSIATALGTIVLKAGAWWLTGSVGLLSDALESLVNLAGALMALAMITVAETPPDEEHAFGHSKAEYFASGFEGMLILVAALAIGWAAIDRLLHPAPLSAVGPGLVVSVIASLLNLATSRILLTAGKRHRSITLVADAHHLMTDVWTSAGVILGVALVAVTGLQWLDPVIALAVGAQIIVTGWSLVSRSAHGLLDVALPASERAELERILEEYRGQGIAFHAVRTRQSGARAFVSMHVLVPGEWSVQRGHDLLEQIEARLREALPHVSVFTHLEPIEDPASFLDQHLDRS